MNPENSSNRGRLGTPTVTLGSLGRRPWLVLGGGGLKGLAHVGAYRALVEEGVEVQGIIGTSIGALVGALISSGMPWQEMRERSLALTRSDIVRINRRAVLFNGIRQPSVFRGDALMDYFASLLPEEGWGALAIPMQLNAVALATGRTHWFGVGARTDVSLVEAVYASAALPAIYPPAMLHGVAFVDGGTEHPLALSRAEELGATGVIGVDVGSGETHDTESIMSQGMVGVAQRIFSIMTYRRRRDLLEAWNHTPLMYVRPSLDGYGTFDFDDVDYFVEEGYRAMKRVLHQELRAAEGSSTEG